MSGSFQLLAEQAHCSQHEYNANGCSDCACSVQLQEHETKLQKTGDIHQLVIEPANPTPKVQLIRQQLARALAVFFAQAKNKAATAAVKKARQLNKAEKQLTHDERLQIALAAYAAIVWTDLVDSVAIDLLAAASAGAMNGLMQLQNKSVEIHDKVSELVDEYAKSRSAEMIGMHYIGKKLVEDPEARFVIADSTRDDLEDLVDDSFRRNLSLEELEEQIKTAAMFNDIRARFIANNETAVANVYGNLVAWKQVGSVKKVNVVLGPDHVVTDICDAHAKGSPYLISEVPLIPAHPQCQCSLENAA